MEVNKWILSNIRVHLEGFFFIIHFYKKLYDWIIVQPQLGKPRCNLMFNALHDVDIK